MRSSLIGKAVGVGVLSAVIAFMSSLSDHVPVVGNIGLASVLLYGLAGICNDFTIWLVCAVASGRAVGTGWRRSVAVACAWSVGTVWLYLAVEALAFGGAPFVGWGGFLTWTVLAGVGGVVGGLIAAFMVRFPVTLAPLVLLGVIRLRDPQPWHSPMGVMHHLAVLVVVLCCLSYWGWRAAVWLRRCGAD